MRALVWFRSDLRVIDNPALHQACDDAGRGVVGVFLISPRQWSSHDWADVRVDFLLRSLVALRDELESLEIPLLVRDVPTFRGAADELLEIARRHECDGLYFNREYEVNEADRDREVTGAFETAGLDVKGFTDQVILPPGSLQTTTGGPYTVYTPFRKAWTKRVEAAGLTAPLRRPRRRAEMPARPETVPERVDGFGPVADLAAMWPAGEREAAKRLRSFIADGLSGYKERRDLPAEPGTSVLSPYLAVGAISPRQCLHAAVEANDGRLGEGREGADTWISELVWREFYRHVLVGFPRVCRHRAFREQTERIRWLEDDDRFTAWCDGRTGFPIVDAAMRQLNATGWMHNRLRMVAAMFVAKDLLIDWRHGERYFMRRLIDGDLASNNGGWQWAASTGTDAVPYFRIFNPASQGKRYDPDGAFVREWVPELADVSARAIHEPAKHPALLADLDYPEPIVDHGKARLRAIDAFKAIR